MRDEEVLRAFSSCGEVVGHKFLRHTNCAFIDFSTQVRPCAACERAVLRRHGWLGGEGESPVSEGGLALKCVCCVGLITS